MTSQTGKEELKGVKVKICFLQKKETLYYFCLRNNFYLFHCVFNGRIIILPLFWEKGFNWPDPGLDFYLSSFISSLHFHHCCQIKSNRESVSVSCYVIELRPSFVLDLSVNISFQIDVLFSITLLKSHFLSDD